jgi:hypothetical protein
MPNSGAGWRIMPLRLPGADEIADAVHYLASAPRSPDRLFSSMPARTLNLIRVISYRGKVSTPAPLSRTLVDRFARRITYLRLSVTDRCDLRCAYCMPERMEFLPRAECADAGGTPPAGR